MTFWDSCVIGGKLPHLIRDRCSSPWFTWCHCLPQLMRDMHDSFTISVVGMPGNVTAFDVVSYQSMVITCTLGLVQNSWSWYRANHPKCWCRIVQYEKRPSAFLGKCRKIMIKSWLRNSCSAHKCQKFVQTKTLEYFASPWFHPVLNFSDVSTYKSTFHSDYFYVTQFYFYFSDTCSCCYFNLFFFHLVNLFRHHLN
jgi:hypothetical protein